MSKSPLTWAQIKALLDDVLPHLQRVDEAPSYSDIETRCWLEDEKRLDDERFQREIEAEIRKHYKAGDQWGAIYIVSAPAWTTYQMMQRKSQIDRYSKEYKPELDQRRISSERAEVEERI